MTSLCLVVALALNTHACTEAGGGLRQGQYRGQSATAEDVEPPRAPLDSTQRAAYLQLARDAWGFLDEGYNHATGFVAATREWAFTTTWDIGSQLLAFRSAKEVGLMTDVEYDRRMTRLLSTLGTARLFNNVAFNKTYSVVDGRMGNGTVVGQTGYSATDLGRLLIAFKVVATRDPKYAERIQQLVRRINFAVVVKGGYMHGSLLRRDGTHYVFQEGRIGYEQYMATGFDLWGIDVANALDYRTNMVSEAQVYGVDLPEDGRWNDRIVSEPFYLLGLEVGFTPEMRQLSRDVLRAQEGRYKSTKQITIATEDALSIPPHYFYYYCVYCNRQPFVIDLASVGRSLNGPRWVSTKGSYAWDAIFPSDYTRLAVAYVAPARSRTLGWASGVYEKSRASTRSYDANTASVLLEVAAFHLRGARPLLEPAAVASQ